MANYNNNVSKIIVVIILKVIIIIITIYLHYTYYHYYNIYLQRTGHTIIIICVARFHSCKQIRTMQIIITSNNMEKFAATQIQP